jgi:hypothetical protein
MMTERMSTIDIKGREHHQEDHLIGKENDVLGHQSHPRLTLHHNRDRQVQIYQTMVQG